MHIFRNRKWNQEKSSRKKIYLRRIYFIKNIHSSQKHKIIYNIDKTKLSLLQSFLSKYEILEYQGVSTGKVNEIVFTKKQSRVNMTE